jgi:hypothetical protein
MRPVDHAVSCIQRALLRIQSDRLTPAAHSAEISDYLIDRTLEHSEDRSEFTRFVTSLPDNAIENELLRLILPDDVRQTIFNYRAEHETLQRKKESEIGKQNFNSARDCRDRQEIIAISIRELTSGQKLVVTPAIVTSALNALGLKKDNAASFSRWRS